MPIERCSCGSRATHACNDCECGVCDDCSTPDCRCNGCADANAECFNLFDDPETISLYDDEDDEDHEPSAWDDGFGDAFDIGPDFGGEL